MKYNKKQQEVLIQDFIDMLFVQRNLSSNTLYAYKNDLQNFSQWLERRHYTDIDAQSIYEYFFYLQNEIELSPRSIRRKYVSIQQYCDYINRILNLNEIFFRFTARKFQLPRTLPRTLSGEEIKNLISTATCQYQQAGSEYKERLAARNMCIIELLFCLGLRVGELSALDVADYRPEDNTVLIHGKGRKERMLFISSPAVCQKLKLWMRKREEMKPKDPAVFLNRNGKRLGIYGIERIFSKYCQLAGINPQATPHYLRHSFATQLLNNGANIRDVQELMGHSSIATTQIYTEISITRKKEVLEKYNGRNFMDIHFMV